MAWRSAGSLSRSLMSTARVSSQRSATSLPRAALRPPNIAAPPRLPSRRLSFASPRNLGELGCTQSLLLMHGVMVSTSHLAVNVRAFCELSHGTFRRSCQDR